MSQPKEASIEPSRPRPQRLDSLRNPLPRPPPRIQKQVPETCVNPDCTEQDRLILEDGKLICESCGTVADDSAELVTDLQFGLEGGRAVLHGRHVGPDSGAVAGGDYGRGRTESSFSLTLRKGKEYIARISSALSVSQTLQDGANQFFTLAASYNFIQGRRIKSVAAVALYLACRMQTQNHNHHMLIDFADVLDIDVFQLGDVYKEFVKESRINGNGFTVPPINPEHLILRFAQKLEFGRETMKVANDAVRIVQRMARDWMTPGRRPAGICGAALIVAARMSNFRRTPREMMYVVKVNPNTILKRLEEFKGVESASLTIEDFRTMWLETDADPPSYAQNQGDTKQGKRRRRRKEVEFGDDGDDFGDETTPSLLARVASMKPQATAGSSEATPRQLPTPGATQQQASNSHDMPPPPIPIDPTLQTSARPSPGKMAGAEERLRSAPTERIQTRSRRHRSVSIEQPAEGIAIDKSPSGPTRSESTSTRASTGNAQSKRPRGRPRKTTRTEPETNDLEIAAALTDPFNASIPALQITAEVAAHEDQARADPQNLPDVPTSIEINEQEFADDPEVQNCLLSEEEVLLKTQIWTSVNQDWLREKAAKQYKHELELANGTYRPKKVRERKRRRIGDLSQYASQLGEDWERRLEAGEGLADSAAKSVEMMLKARGFSRGKQFSAKINYEKIKDLYTPSTASRRTSVVDGGSPSIGEHTPPHTGRGDEIGLGASEKPGSAQEAVEDGVPAMIEDSHRLPSTDDSTLQDLRNQAPTQLAVSGAEHLSGAPNEPPAGDDGSEDEYFDNEAAARRLAEQKAKEEEAVEDEDDDDDDDDEGEDEDGDDGDTMAKIYDDDDPYEAVGAESE